MNQRTLSLLLVSLLALGGVYYLSLEEPASSAGELGARKLFDTIDGARVAKLQIQKGEEKIDLAFKDDVWTVPERSHYPADFGKVRSLLLKVLDLKVSQRVTGNPDKHSTLGVTEESVNAGKAKISIFDSGDADLGAIYMGEFRKSDSSQPTAGFAGQYVRRSDQNDVFLVAQTIGVITGIKNWLDTRVTNVLKSRVSSITQESVTSESATTLFALSKKASLGEEGSSGFSLKGVTLAADEEENTATISTISSALENLRMQDVFPAGDKELEGLVYDFRSTFTTENGIRYIAQSAEKEVKVDTGEEELDPRYFLVLRAELDQAIVAELAKAAEAAAKAEAEKKAAAAEAAAKKALADAASESEEAKPVVKAVAVTAPATAEEVKKLNDSFQKWVYEVPKYVGSKFRYQRADVVQKKAAEAS